MSKTTEEDRQNDIHEMAQALRESETRFRYLAAAAFEGIAIHAKGVLLTGNDQIFEMLGYRPEELIGKDALRICVAEESIPLVIEKIRSKDFAPYEATALHKDGTRFPVEIRAREIEWEGRKARVAAVMDITERKRSEALLRVANEELEQRVAERTEKLVDAIGQLKQSKDELRRLSSEILNAQENERRRIAHELHDSIGQTLSAIKIKLNYTLEKMHCEESQECRLLWKDLLAVVQNAIEEARFISEGLRPPALDDLGILSTIEWFCADLQKANRQIEFEEKHLVREEDIPEQLKIVMYRVLQESLYNTVRHSEASRVMVALNKIDGTLTLEISDNGRGFDMAERCKSRIPQRGLGLGTMKERVKLSGGSFSVKSRPAHGTTVLAQWDLDSI